MVSFTKETVKYIERPMLFFLIFNVIGVFSQYLDYLYVGFFCALLFLFLLNIFYNCKNIFLVFCICSFFVGVNTITYNENKIEMLKNYYNQDIEIEGKVVRVSSDEKFYIKVKDSNIDNIKNEKVVIYAEEKEINIGDEVYIEGEVESFIEKNNFAGFNEELYEISNGVIGKINASYININKTFSSKIINKFNNNINKNIMFENREIIRTMVLGDKTELDTNLKELYRTAGIYHILAISGLHIGIIYSFLSIMFNRIRFLNKHKYLIIILLMYYSYLTGSSVSTVRAIFMCSILILSTKVQRTYDVLNTLYFVGFILIIHNPYLLFSIGFLYSFLCVLGIGLYKNDIDIIIRKLLMTNEYLFKKLSKKVIVDTVSVILSVTIVITPINAYCFNTINTYSILANFLITPFVTLLVLSAFFVTVFGGIHIVTFVFNPIITFIFYIFNNILNLINILPYANIIIRKVSIFEILIYYGLIYFTIKYLVYKNNRHRILGVIILVIIIIINIVPKRSSIVFLNEHYNEELNVVIESGNTVAIVSNSKSILNLYTINNYLDYIGVEKADIYININPNFYIDPNYSNELNFKTLILPLDSVEKDIKIEYNELYEILQNNEIDLKSLKNSEEIIFNDVNIKLYIYDKYEYLLNIYTNNYNFNLFNDSFLDIEKNKIVDINYGGSENFKAIINVEGYEENTNSINNLNLLDHGDIKFIIKKKLKVKMLR